MEQKLKYINFCRTLLEPVLITIIGFGKFSTTCLIACICAIIFHRIKHNRNFHVFRSLCVLMMLGKAMFNVYSKFGSCPIFINSLKLASRITSTLGNNEEYGRTKFGWTQFSYRALQLFTFTMNSLVEDKHFLFFPKR